MEQSGTCATESITRGNMCVDIDIGALKMKVASLELRLFHRE